jgi:hypothetical protein
MGYGVNVFAVAVFLVAAVVSTDGQQVQLPMPNCNAPSELQMNDTCGADCWSTYINPSQMFADCRDFSTNVSLSFPSPACCSGVVNASTYFLPRCFCRYIFHPAPNMGIIPARRLALPQLCNVTDLCQMCTSLKPAPPCSAESSGTKKITLSSLDLLLLQWFLHYFFFTNIGTSCNLLLLLLLPWFLENPELASYGT